MRKLTVKIGTQLRITKREWYARGGFKNTKLFRRGVGPGWTYWMVL